MNFFEEYRIAFSTSKEASATQYIPVVGGAVHGLQDPERKHSRAITALAEGVPGFLGGSAMSLLTKSLTDRSARLQTPVGKMVAAAALLIAASVGTAAGSKSGRSIL